MIEANTVRSISVGRSHELRCKKQLLWAMSELAVSSRYLGFSLKRAILFRVFAKIIITKLSRFKISKVWLKEAETLLSTIEKGATVSHWHPI